VAIPGGVGTLDELFEAWSWNALGYHAKPFALLNEDGFWDELIAFLDTATRAASCRPPAAPSLSSPCTPDEAIDLLADACQGGEAKMVW
jgi:predicted Rossmann-fold nucleotide-binding protein